ncbi:PP0621 family protein [uncultured Helicobacter sp.]|uniref:PP0621 family protein n=1 Tax=uncultured Helicobacter sp. TaxID=175537 RepID=UPI00374E6039
MKFLIIIVALFVVVWFLLLRPSLSSSASKASRKSRKDLPSEIMRECCVCGVFVSEREGMRVGEKFFCSKECRAKG